MSSDLEVQGTRATVKVTETVTRGKVFKLDTSNHWPNVLVTTAESVFALGVFLCDGVSGDMVDAILFGPVLTGYGIATEGSRISAGASGTFEVASADGYPVGVALDTAASAATFRFIPISYTVHAA